MSVQDMASAARKYVTRKVLLGGSALLSGVAMIVLFTFVPYTWKPERLMSGEFVTDTLIIVAITLLGMVCMIFISQATNASNIASKLSKAMAAFKAAKERILDKHAFKQWVRDVQQPRDLRDIKQRILSKAGVDDPTILNLTEDQILKLTESAQKYGDEYYPALTKAQAKLCIALKSGVKVHFPSPEVYLSAKSVLDDRTPSERLSSEGKKKSGYALVSIASKVIMTIAVSMIFTMFVRDTMENADAMEAAGKFAVRMMNLCTSSFLGFIIGGQLNDIDAEYVDLRVEVFEDYLHDDTYRPMTVKEAAKAEYEALDTGCQNQPPQL